MKWSCRKSILLLNSNRNQTLVAVRNRSEASWTHLTRHPTTRRTTLSYMHEIRKVKRTRRWTLSGKRRSVEISITRTSSYLASCSESRKTLSSRNEFSSNKYSFQSKAAPYGRQLRDWRWCRLCKRRILPTKAKDQSVHNKRNQTYLAVDQSRLKG